MVRVMDKLSAHDERLKAEGDARKASFLSALRGTTASGAPSIRRACEESGVGRGTVRAWRESDPSFADAYADALDDGTDLLEDEAIRRASSGVEEPIYQGGELVGTKIRYSDDLMKFMLAGRRPSVYRQGAEVNVQNNQVTMVDDQQLARALSLLISEAQKTQALGD